MTIEELKTRHRRISNSQFATPEEETHKSASLSIQYAISALDKLVEGEHTYKVMTEDGITAIPEYLIYRLIKDLKNQIDK